MHYSCYVLICCPLIGDRVNTPRKTVGAQIASVRCASYL